jgi:hypothetical protein
MATRTLALLCLAACGGAHTAAGPPPPSSTKPAETAEPASPNEIGETGEYAELTAYFKRKRPLISQCYAAAIQDGQIKGDEVGYVTVALVVQPTGKGEKVHVARTSLRSAAVEDCIVKMVKGWVLPPPQKPLDFMFAYEFKP